MATIAFPFSRFAQIVWDDAKKKWVSSDGGAEEEEQFRPPPKMADMMGGSSQHSNSNSNHSMPQQPPQSRTPAPPAVEQAPHPAAYSTPTPSYAQPPQPQQLSKSTAPGFDMSALHMPAPLNSPHSSDAAATPAPAADANAAPTKTPNLQSNMFKMQRNRSEFRAS